ncbi:pectate lyase [Pirellulales bacterium]|nr:pectate lyase [Pirellulales bacterium]
MHRSVLALGACWLILGGVCWSNESAEAADAAPAISPLATTGPKPGPISPPSGEAIDDAIRRGVDFLLETQFKHGAWGGPQNTKSLNIYAPVPGSHRAFRTGVTSLAIMALTEAREQFDGSRREQIEAALDRGQEWLLKNASVLRRAEAEALYNVWGHAYACHAITRLHARADGDPGLQARLIELLKYQVDRLERYTFVNGGWGYYDFEAHTRKPSGSPTSFTTATALIALKDAAQLGAEYPDELAEKAIGSILRQRQPDFSYAYGEYLRMYPRYGINRPAGSLGRSQACNLALRLYGHEEVTDEVIKTWLDRLYARNGWLSIGRKYPVPHESHFGVAGYFYYYGHFYAALCIDVLPEADRAHFQDHLAHILLPLQEKDGSWWDYPLYDYHQQYGTAMAVSSLLRCRREEP